MLHQKRIVYVIMGNGYPEAVFSTYSEAAKFCEKKTGDERRRKIFWRQYSFVLDEQVERETIS